MRMAIIGCGGIANVHARDLVNLINKGEDVEVSFLVDVREDNALRLKKKWGFDKAEVVRDYRSIIGKVDAAIICTPHTLHYPQALDLIKNNVHVLLEKPMVCKLEHAVDLIEAAEESKVVLEVAYQRHFIPCFIAAREFVRKGGLGRVRLISLLLAQNWYEFCKGTWRLTQKLGGGGELMDSGSHIIDIALWVTGLKPFEVYAAFDKYDSEVDINTGLVAKMDNGAILNFTVAGDDPSGWMEIELFWGDRGRLSIMPPKVLFIGRDRREAQLDTLNITPSRPVYNFIDVILGRDYNRSPGIGALYVVALSEAAYEAANRGRPISIKELCEIKGVDYSKFFGP